jgi:hypothetical protein
MILVAERPLKICEMNVAVNMNSQSKSFEDIDLEDDADFKKRLRSFCGLFISVHHDKIYFLHQTAREFLLGASNTHLYTPASLPGITPSRPNKHRWPLQKFVSRISDS